MKIAYVSFEYPPESAFGGIGTYVYQASRLMMAMGHRVEIFSSSPTSNSSENIDGMFVHRVLCTDRSQFPSDICDLFSSRHTSIKFDVMESPEYSGDGYQINKKYPDLPIVVKLHTPSYFIHELNNCYITWRVKARYIIGGLLRGKLSKAFWKWKNKNEDIDYLLTVKADLVSTPSLSLGDIVSRKWGIERWKIKNVPYPFIPTKAFLEISSDRSGSTVTFIGRLEVRKGIISFLEAIPIILEAVPEATIKFVGKIVPAVILGLTINEHLDFMTQRYPERIQFLTVTPDEIPQVLAQTDVCVFPSIWENFPNVCLEAMSAGRSIVASKNGGMNDMLTNPTCGILIDPLKPKAIAESVIGLLKDPNKRVIMGDAARKAASSKYNAETIGPLMESMYEEAIQLSRKKLQKAI